MSPEGKSFSPPDERFMRLALRLAARGKGFTNPNPAVGAVLAKGGGVIAKAWHRRSGEPHAEAQVLKAAGAAARNATLYVTMEPCCTRGRTPPCTRAIVEAGIRRVVVAVRDPNPRHCGRGLTLLERAGIRVDEGLLSDKAAAMIEDFAKHIRTGLPFTTVKVAATLDGKIAAAGGDSRWVSGPASRRLAHRLRLVSDAVLVGRRTAERDDPLLTARVPGLPPRIPLRIVADSMARLPLGLELLKSPLVSRTVVAVSSGAPQGRVMRLEAAGATVIRCRARAGRVSFKDLWRRLGRRGVMSLLVEGGGEVIASALEAGLVDRIMLFISPRIAGGRLAPTPVGGEGVRRISDALPLERISVRRLGGNLLIEGHVKRGDRLRAGERYCRR